jgi:hypothetical protein
MERVVRARVDRAADRLEQSVHGGGTQAADPPVQRTVERPRAAGQRGLRHPVGLRRQIRVGLSGGSGDQDTACGLAALQALQDLLAPKEHRVLVQADIKEK